MTRIRPSVYRAIVGSIGCPIMQSLNTKWAGGDVKEIGGYVPEVSAKRGLATLA